MRACSQRRSPVGRIGTYVGLSSAVGWATIPLPSAAIDVAEKNMLFTSPYTYCTKSSLPCVEMRGDVADVLLPTAGSSDPDDEAGGAAWVATSATSWTL